MDFVGISEDSDDIIEFRFLKYDLNFDLNLVYVNIN